MTEKKLMRMDDQVIFKKADHLMDEALILTSDYIKYQQAIGECQ